MSSTNRSNSRDFHVADYYKTPVPSITDFLMEYFDDTQDDWSGKSILDPCAGGDSSHGMSYPEAILKWNFTNPPAITTLDIRGDSKADIKPVDYRMWEAPKKFDIIITNPPFAIALEIIQKALRDCQEGGIVIMLLRLNFFGSRERSSWFEKFMPTWCYVHSKRMKFTGTKNTDSIEYMHAVWQAGSYPKFTKLRII